MSKRNGKPIHGDALRPTPADWRYLPSVLEEKFLSICELYGRESGGCPLPISKEMLVHFARWREVLMRHRKGDYRNSESEWKSIREVAQFIFDWFCKLRGQEPKKLEWVE